MLKYIDLLVFTALESLGAMAVIGNVSLIIVLLRFKYLNRASFILMLSLAIADVLHGLVTTLYFYPPIALKRHHLPLIAMRVFNIIDWTAWAITLTHMSAICLDRLIAILLYGRYSAIVTVLRVRNFSVLCWLIFLTANTTYFILNICCMIVPLEEQDFYSFGYHHNETKFRGSGILNYTNIYVYTYTPIELLTIIILSISNPATVVQLYRRHKRKLALRQASTLLIEVSMKMGSRIVHSDVKELAARRANRQQQRIMVQITVVAAIFYSYMSAYYLSYYVFAINTKWANAFHSFFYSTTHMINPVIYFTSNSEMRKQLGDSLCELWHCITFCRHRKEVEVSFGSKSARPDRTSNKLSVTTATETSPFFSSNRRKSTETTRHSTQRDSIVSSLAHFVEGVSPKRTDDSISTITKEVNGKESNDTASKNSLMKYSKSAESSKEGPGSRQRMSPVAETRLSSTVLDRIICSLKVDNGSRKLNDDFASDAESELSPVSRSWTEAPSRKQSWSFEIATASCAAKPRHIRGSSTMDGLPGIIREISRTAMDVGTRLASLKTRQHHRALMRSSTTEDDAEELEERHLTRSNSKTSGVVEVDETKLCDHFGWRRRYSWPTSNGLRESQILLVDAFLDSASEDVVFL